MLWARILKTLKDNGYKGGDADLVAIKSFLDSANVDIKDDAGAVIDIEAAFKAGNRKSLTIDKPETEAPEVSQKRADEKAEQKEVRAKGTDWANAHDGVLVTKSPGSFANDAARKSYNRKAKEGRTAFSDGDTAEAFGAWLRLHGVCKGRTGYARAAEDKAILGKTGITYSDTLGGALVPEAFLPDLIDLREQYGEVAPLCRNIDMSGDTITIPRRTGGLTVYRPGEGGAITASDTTYDNVTLTAVKDATLTHFTPELLNDAAINIADRTAEEIVYAFEKALDDAIINGLGNSSYSGKAVGIGLAFRQVVEGAGGTWATNADYGAGIVVGTGNLWSELVDQDYSTLVGRLPKYAASSPNSVWLMSQVHWGEKVEPLIRAAGGATTMSYQERLVPAFKGFRVVTSQLMPRVNGNSTFPAFLGDFSKAITIGRVRNSMAITTSTDFDFDNDVISVKGVHRVAIGVHDVGNASSTAASREPGPIVGLLTAAS